MKTSNIRDWLKTSFPEINDIRVGRLKKTNHEKALAIRRGTTQSQQIAIGGLANTSYARLACNCILHWNNSYTESEQKANEIVEFLNALKHPIISGIQIVRCTVRNGPIDIGFDEYGIYEWAIDFELMYMRK